MTSGIRVAMASIAASFVVLFASTWAPAHEAHKKQAQAAASEVSRREPAAPAAASSSETKPHDHMDHDSIPGPKAGDTQPAAPASNVPAPLAWLGKFHPLVTHFPIALILSAAVAELLYLRRGTALFDHAVRFSIWLGAGGALAAALLGWFFAGFHFVDDEWIMTAHRWMGTTTALWAAGLLVPVSALRR